MSRRACLPFLLLLGPAAAFAGVDPPPPDAAAPSPERCLAAPYSAPETGDDPARMHALLSAVQPALAAMPALEQALMSASPLLCIFDGPAKPRGYYDVERNVIGLAERLSDGEAQLILLHELRHLEQDVRGACPADLLSMQEYARGVQAIEADAMATAALGAWVLRSAGAPAAWEAMSAWPEYADIPQRLAVVLEGGGNANTALSAAFTQWFQSDWRTDSYYLSACSDYLDRQDIEHRLPSYDALPSGFFEDLCRAPDGAPYDCTVE